MGHLSLVTLLLMYLNRLTKRNKYFGGCNIQLDPTCWVFLLHREQDFCNFCCKPPKIKFCIEEVSVGEIYNTLLDSNEGDLSPYTLQTIYFSKTDENKMSDKEAPHGRSCRIGHWALMDNFYQHQPQYISNALSFIISVISYRGMIYIYMFLLRNCRKLVYEKTK